MPKCAANSVTMGMGTSANRCGNAEGRCACPVRVTVVCHYRSLGEGLHEEGANALLEVGDGTVGVGKGGSEMGQDLSLWPGRRIRRPLRWRTLAAQCRANVALRQAEPTPNALHGSVTPRTVDSADGREEAAGGGELEKSPQTAGGQAQASDLVCDPNAECATAPVPGIAIATKDPPCADGFSLGGGVVKSSQNAMPNEHADDLAVRTGGEFEVLTKGVPFVVAAVKELLLPHDWTMPPKNRDEIAILQGRGSEVR